MHFNRIKIKPHNLIMVRDCITASFLWILLMYSYIYFAWWAIKDYFAEGLFPEYLELPVIHIELFIQGISFGVLFGVVNYFTDKTTIRKKSFGAIILIKSVFYLLAVFISMFIVDAFYFVFDITPVQVSENFKSPSIPFLISLSIYIILTVVFINLFTQLNHKFGRGIFWNMIKGTYHKPREERRIFMFLDLKDSTKIAEKLGHYNYSRFIQSCIYDLTEYIICYKARVYQYVGDEIVLSWKVNSGLFSYNSIFLFYAFQNKLNKREDYYLTTFGVKPEFKSGLDEGIVTVTEVGEIKREIAYHGSILNTASRLEKLCNKLNSNILISDSLYRNLPESSLFKTKLAGEFQLKGKGRKEKVYGIEKASGI